MARAVEVFRENGLRVSQMTEAEAARIISDQQSRKEMMAELQSAFGDVVDAAMAGDFSAVTGIPRCRAQCPGRGRQQSGRDRRSRPRRDRRRARGAGRHRPDPARGGRLPGRLRAGSRPTPMRWPKSSTEIVGQLRETSRSLKTATGEILSGANDLSERTTKQAATIEETSAAMEQLAATVLQNAKRAKDASANAGTGDPHRRRGRAGDGRRPPRRWSGSPPRRARSPTSSG